MTTYTIQINQEQLNLLINSLIKDSNNNNEEKDLLLEMFKEINGKNEDIIYGFCY